MKKLLLSLTALVATMVSAQTEEYFEPYVETDLRLPSVPIIVNDPYFSIWSPYDQLIEGPTCHWTGNEKPIDGLLRVDGTAYRFMGTELEYVLDETIAPMTDEELWTAKVTTETQNGIGWTKTTYDDSDWETQSAAWGSPGEYPNVSNSWEGDDIDIYIRRTVTLTAEDLEKDLYIMYSHDDVFQLFINGHLIISTGLTWLEGEVHHLTTAQVKYLVEGDNIIAAHGHNTTGGAYVDYGLYANSKVTNENIETATQKSVDVLATNTYYTFECGPVDLDLVFTAPMIIDDLDLLSTPINYISYQVTSTDGEEHDVQIYIATSPMLAVNESSQATRSRLKKTNGVTYLYTGTSSQDLLGTTGDGVCIDWGYLYLPDINGSVSLCSTLTVENTFVEEGTLPTTSRIVTASKQSEYPTLAYMHDFGTVDTASSFMMIGYDEVKDIQYLGKQYVGYWARDGKDIEDAFEEMRDNYDDIMTRCRAMDKLIYDDGLTSGDAQYAEILSATYRHCIAAHKLFQGPNDNIYFFSKENNSGGFVNTVDLTYPSSPLFLLYNPELQKGMIRSVFEYCETSAWGFGFAAHDLGLYPVADGQKYSITSPDSDGGFSGNMPLEESGNIVTLCAIISMIDGNTDFADEHWDTVQLWADYLSDNGQDPANQLCTDDFAGFLAHNANLSVKAIMGVAGFAEMARIKGDTDTYETYMARAREMAAIWEEDAADDDHYALTLDGSGTWSQKYNMVWDRLWQLDLFSDEVMEKEIAYYLTKQNTYGLPLDSRSAITKSDWIMWTASMSPDKDTFLEFVAPLYKYANETTSRVPMSDYYNSSTGVMVGFKGRSVVGGHWMRVLVDNFDKYTPGLTGISSVTTSDASASAKLYYGIDGTARGVPAKGLNIVKYSDGSAKKVVLK